MQNLHTGRRLDAVDVTSLPNADLDAMASRLESGRTSLILPVDNAGPYQEERQFLLLVGPSAGQNLQRVARNYTRAIYDYEFKRNSLEGTRGTRSALEPQINNLTKRIDSLSEQYTQLSSGRFFDHFGKKRYQLIWWGAAAAAFAIPALLSFVVTGLIAAPAAGIAFYVAACAGRKQIRNEDKGRLMARGQQAMGDRLKLQQQLYNDKQLVAQAEFYRDQGRQALSQILPPMNAAIVVQAGNSLYDVVDKHLERDRRNIQNEVVETQPLRWYAEFIGALTRPNFNGDRDIFIDDIAWAIVTEPNEVNLLVSTAMANGLSFNELDIQELQFIERQVGPIAYAYQTAQQQHAPRQPQAPSFP